MEEEDLKNPNLKFRTRLSSHLKKGNMEKKILIIINMSVLAALSWTKIGHGNQKNKIVNSNRL